MKETYLQPNELLVRWSDSSEFDSAQISASIVDSFSMVNSFMNSNLKLPVMEADGDVPAILRQCQLEFVKYLLISNDQGQSDDLKELYDRNTERCRKITQNELLISEIAITQLDIGWTITENNFTSGSVYVRGSPPSVDMSYEITATTSSYVGNATFDAVRSDSPSVYKTFAGTFDTWTLVADGLEVRFDGRLVISESFNVKGVADTQNVISSHDIIKQSPLVF